MNQDDFYQEMMGEYVINSEYPQLDFTKNQHVHHVPAKKVFPVYAHQMFRDDPKNNQKRAFLYFYYNTEPRKVESQCPEGCWIISKSKTVSWFPLQWIINPIASNSCQACMTWHQEITGTETSTTTWKRLREAYRPLALITWLEARPDLPIKMKWKTLAYKLNV